MHTKLQEVRFVDGITLPGNIHLTLMSMRNSAHSSQYTMEELPNGNIRIGFIRVKDLPIEVPATKVEWIRRTVDEQRPVSAVKK